MIRTPLFALGAALLLAGCHGNPASVLSTEQGRAQQKAQQSAQMESQREQMDQIPPPAKGRYMAIHSFESWENPYLTVQPGMFELHVTLADANTSTLGEGGMLRPIGARRQELNIALDDLGEAITAVPQSAWPYGRVIAIEEAHKTPAAQEPSVRRNMESAINKLSDLGIVVYDPDEGKVQ
jgi:hypothetical protein